MANTGSEAIRQAFRPRARLLQLLGDQLIGSPKLAVFELVKNAYDADASHVEVVLRKLGSAQATITVRDDGQGMALDTIRDVWLVPGDDYRERQRTENVRSPKFHRLPLGEKGVGRFAVHKLGDRVTMVTRAAGHLECIVEIDWSELIEKRFLEEALVMVSQREPEVFTDDQTGTLITVEKLHEREWSRRDVRDLYRQVTSIASPFGENEGDFVVSLKVPEHRQWIANLPDPAQLLRRAPWHFKFSFDGERLTFQYDFRGVPYPRTVADPLCRRLL